MKKYTCVVWTTPNPETNYGEWGGHEIEVMADDEETARRVAMETVLRECEPGTVCNIDDVDVNGYEEVDEPETTRGHLVETMTNYETITRADRHYLTLMNQTRADLNAAIDYVCSAFAHNPERAISESNLATVAAIDAINTALKALNAPRPVRKYRVKKITTTNFILYPRKLFKSANSKTKTFWGWNIRRYGTTIPRTAPTLKEGVNVLNTLQQLYNESGC